VDEKKLNGNAAATPNILRCQLAVGGGGEKNQIQTRKLIRVMQTPGGGKFCGSSVNHLGTPTRSLPPAELIYQRVSRVKLKLPKSTGRCRDESPREETRNSGEESPSQDANSNTEDRESRNKSKFKVWSSLLWEERLEKKGNRI